MRTGSGAANVGFREQKAEVWRDLESIAEYLERQSFDLPFRFLDAAERTFERLAANPEAGFLYDFSNPGLAGLRVAMIRGFEKYLVFYQRTETGIDVFRVLYGGRDLDTMLGN